jgi:hypothetical protein
MNKKNDKKADFFEDFEKKHLEEFSILGFIMTITWLPLILYFTIKKIFTGKNPPPIKWKN